MFDSTKATVNANPCGAQGCGIKDADGNWQCFVAGTKVHSKTGLIDIEKVEVGDFVLAKSELTGEIAYKRVLETFITQGERIVRIEFNGGVLESTPNHRFWLSKGDWVSAEKLSIGDELVDPVGGKIIITAISSYVKSQSVYNLTVAGTRQMSNKWRCRYI